MLPYSKAHNQTVTFRSRTIQFQVDLNSGLPIYRQLMNQFRFYIASGAIAPDEKLPSIRSLSKQLAVNPTTIVKAYNELAHAGVIELRQGRGAFALAPTVDEEQDLKELLTPLARQLVTEATSAGASKETVIELIEEEYVRSQQHKEKE